MNDTLNKLFIFTAGAVIGSAVTWKLLKTKYELIAQEEINSVKETLLGRESKADTESEENKEESEDEDPAFKRAQKPDIREYAERIQKAGYVNYSNTEKPEAVVLEETNKPYVISPDEFGEKDNYEVLSFTYYADGVLADDDDIIVDNVDGIVGEESLKTFGQYEDDSVFVRNDRLKTDYEILLDSRNYTEVP